MGDDTREEVELLEVKSDDSCSPVPSNCNETLTDFKPATLDLPEELLQAVLQNEYSSINSILNNSSVDILFHRYRHHDRKTILAIACIESQVSSKTVRTLYQSIKLKYGILDFTDSEWYGWEPIHFAAKTADPTKLEALVDHMDDINNLTAFSENALHILLSRAVQPFQVVLCNGSESRPFSIISKERNNVIDCVKILLRGGIDLNHTNFWNEAPICLAAR